eukprot:15469274-Alexandrium_andersonii.AAC.1
MQCFGLSEFLGGAMLDAPGDDGNCIEDDGVECVGPAAEHVFFKVLHFSPSRWKRIRAGPNVKVRNTDIVVSVHTCLCQDMGAGA